MGQEEGNLMKKAELQAMTKSELEELARDHDVEGRSTMSKDELVEVLGSVRSTSKSTKGETIMTTPRENQDALGHHTRGGGDSLTFEQEPAEGATADQSSAGGTGGTTVGVTDSSGTAGT